MKKYLSFSLALALLGAGYASAGPVDSQQALEIAKEFYLSKLNAGGKAKAPANIDFTIAFDSNDNLGSSNMLKANAASMFPTYYVVSAGADNGFVVVSGDDETEQVLGYTLDGQIDTNNIPVNMQSWLDFYDSEIEYLRTQNRDLGMPIEPLTDPADNYTTVIYPLLKDIKWNQDAPYNNQCPRYNNRATYVGCVATAMGQILYYYRYPTQPEGTVNYITSTLGINVNVNFNNVTFDFDKMLPNYDVTPGTAEQQAEVAKFLYHVGVAARMDYGIDASGANDYSLAKGLTENLGFSNSLRIMNRANTSLADWHAAIQSELAKGKPVYHTGSGDGGHAFVCDGYDGAGMYHFNWGWGGISDGYFRLTSLNPATQGIGGNTMGYDYMQSIFVNLEPKGDTEADSRTEISICFSDFTVQDRTEGLMISDNEVGRNDNVTLTSGVMCSGAYNFTGFVGALLVDNDENVVTELSRTLIANLQPSYMRGSVTWSFSIPTSVADGTYRLRLGYKENQYANEDWILMSGWYAKAPSELAVNVTSSGVTYSELGVADLEAFDIEVPEHIYQNRVSQFKIKFRNNNGYTYYSYMGVVLRAKDSGLQQTNINTIGMLRRGDEGEYTVSGNIILAPGEYYIYPLYDANADISDPDLRILPNTEPVSVTIESASSTPSLELVELEDGSTTLDIMSGNGYTSRFNVRIKNNSDYFAGNFRFRINNMNMTNYAFGYAEIQAGETVNVEMSGELMLEPGTYIANVGYQTGNAFIPMSGSYTVNVEQFSGINETSGADGIKVYPNPATDYVTIEAGTAIEAVELYDVNGALIKVVNGDAGSLTLDVSNLSKGLYIAKVRLTDETSIHRIIKK